MRTIHILHDLALSSASTPTDEPRAQFDYYTTQVSDRDLPNDMLPSSSRPPVSNVESDFSDESSQGDYCSIDTGVRECNSVTIENGSEMSVEFAKYEGRDLSAEYWGPIMSISEEALNDLLKGRIIVRAGSRDASNYRLISCQHGVYNAAYILQDDSQQKFCVRVPACAWKDRWNEYDKELLRQTALIMRMLIAKTKLPIPKVITYDCSFDNEIRAPFILMSCVAGSSVTQVWDADTGSVPKEVRRQNILRSVAQAVSELQTFRFSKMGSLWFNEDSDDMPEVGETWKLRMEGYIMKRRFEVLAPSFSTRAKVLKDLQSFLDAEGFQRPLQDPFAMGLCELYILLTKAFLAAAEVPLSGAKEEFVLLHADFDKQNVLVDDAGNLTGMLDWDASSTYSAQAGWSMPPLWLQEDWYPEYHWPSTTGVNFAMVRPDQFERYRQDYARYLCKACEYTGDCKYTTKSHIYRAFLKSMAGPWEARRFAANVLAEILPRLNGVDYCTQLGEYGFRSGEEEWLQNRLQVLFKPELPRPSSETIEQHLASNTALHAAQFGRFAWCSAVYAVWRYLRLLLTVAATWRLVHLLSR